MKDHRMDLEQSLMIKIANTKRDEFLTTCERVGTVTLQDCFGNDFVMVVWITPSRSVYYMLSLKYGGPACGVDKFFRDPLPTNANDFGTPRELMNAIVSTKHVASVCRGRLESSEARVTMSDNCERYYTLLIRDDKTSPWRIEFGDFDREVAEDERQEHRQNGSWSVDLKIISTRGDSQHVVDDAVRRLNNRTGD